MQVSSNGLFESIFLGGGGLAENLIAEGPLAHSQE